jgi:hypothetical protein
MQNEHGRECEQVEEKTCCELPSLSVIPFVSLSSSSPACNDVLASSLHAAFSLKVSVCSPIYPCLTTLVFDADLKPVDRQTHDVSITSVETP